MKEDTYPHVCIQTSGFKSVCKTGIEVVNFTKQLVSDPSDPGLACSTEVIFPDDSPTDAPSIADGKT